MAEDLPTGSTLKMKHLAHGSDGSNAYPLKVDATGALVVGSSALPSGAATEAKQDDAITALGLLAKDATVSTEAKQDDAITALGLLAKDATVSTAALQTSILAATGQEQRVSKSGSVATYDGTEIEVTGLVANGLYDLISVTYLLHSGTGGNKVIPSIGEKTGFTIGDADDRYSISAEIVDGDARQVDVVRPLPVTPDGDGKLYIKGTLTGAADSTLYWRIDLALNRSI